LDFKFAKEQSESKGGEGYIPYMENKMNDLVTELEGLVQNMI